MNMNIEYALVLVAFKLLLLHRIALERREYMADEPDGSWTTNNARELEMWTHRFIRQVA